MTLSDCQPKQLFKSVPIAEVNCENINSIWPCLVTAIRNAQLVAVDLELSGLGDRMTSKRLYPDRYGAVRQAAQSRSIFSIGIATFQNKENDTSGNQKQMNYKCKVFDILSLENVPFVVEPDALTFLSEHNFDFNHLLTHGIGYSKMTISRDNVFKSLWEEILASGASIALHNGLVDLAFIYQHFYLSLPEKSDVFLADLADWFGERNDPYKVLTCSIWDSKYLAGQSQQFASTYLDYVFRKAQRDNHRRMLSKKMPYIAITFKRFPKEIRENIFYSRVDCSLTQSFLSGKLADIQQDQLCRSYKEYGHCKYRIHCDKKHDVDLILDCEDKRSKTKREKEKRRRARVSVEHAEENDSIEQAKDSSASTSKKRKSEDEPTTSNFENESTTIGGMWKQFNGKVTERGAANNLSVRGRHRAGMDAFMTGFATIFLNIDFAYQNNGKFDKRLSGRLPLPGKQIPLLIQKSKYVSQSEQHQLLWHRIDTRRRGFDDAKCNNGETTIEENEISALNSF